MSGLIIGLTGKRQVGKSVITKYLKREHGFVSVHPFNGGKAACRALYEHYGASPQEAWEMTDGSLKDTPSSYLPGGVPSRFFMEELGRFMGQDLGLEWTLGKEIELAMARDPNVRIIAESIAYEEPLLRKLGGHIFEVTRSLCDPAAVTAHRTDKGVAGIIPDGSFANDYETEAEMVPELIAFLSEHGIDLDEAALANAMA
jgi:hypothetical protein